MPSAGGEPLDGFGVFDGLADPTARGATAVPAAFDGLGTLDDLVAAGRIDPGWARALEPVAPALAEVEAFLRAESAAGRGVLPAADLVLRAFAAPLDDVRVLVVGQDPYPTPGHPIGLSFAVERHVRPLPRSLSNVYAELAADLGVEPPAHGDLSSWTANGVMLLNRVLTVRPGEAGSHRRRGWEQVTDHAIRVLAARGTPLVAILWGNDAQQLRPLLGGTPVIESAHPSPLSARRGFFGSRPFSRADELLAAQGAAPVDWSIA
ncbi:uracil-DNA glycosylase [Agromyces sp. NPDC058110]|uniref:uracil-DNA glycosylase n=1 Tax=Agromyces sp. NPDC058110 TaxID=3346345 RepID=UPI0036DAF586